MITVSQLMTKAGLQRSGCVDWGTAVPETSGGVYVISTDSPLSLTTSGLSAGLQERWIEGQTIIYIGRSINLRRRLSQFYRHVHGNVRPHRGGQDVLLIRSAKFVTWALAADYASAERRLLETFESLTGKQPFGNRMRSAAMIGETRLPIATRSAR